LRLISVLEKGSVSELHESQNSEKSGTAFSGGREPVGDGGKRPVGPEGRGQSARRGEASRPGAIGSTKNGFSSLAGRG
jgi:hypothetical protein